MNKVYLLRYKVWRSQKKLCKLNGVFNYICYFKYCERKVVEIVVVLLLLKVPLHVKLQVLNSDLITKRLSCMYFIGILRNIML